MNFSGETFIETKPMGCKKQIGHCNENKREVKKERLL